MAKNSFQTHLMKRWKLDRTKQVLGPSPKDKSPFSGIIRAASAMLFPAMCRATAVSVLERSVVTAVAGRNTTADRQHQAANSSHRTAARGRESPQCGVSPQFRDGGQTGKSSSSHPCHVIMSSCHPVTAPELFMSDHRRKYFYANSRVKWNSGNTSQA